MSGDPYWNDVVLAMHMDGRDTTEDPHANSVVLNMRMNSLADDTGKTVTPFGDAAISTAQSKFGGASAYFDGNGDYLTLPTSPDFAFGTGDFTIEAWVYWIAPSGSAQKGIFQLSTSNGFEGQGGNIGIFCNTGTVWALYTGSAGVISSSTAITGSIWNHVSIVRHNGITKLYVNGNSIISYTDSFDYTGQSGVIGGYYNSGYVFNGYIDDLRITKGVARYTSNFTPPTTEIPVVTGPIFRDEKGKTFTVVDTPSISTANYKFGGASYAATENKYIQASAITTDFAFGTGDFTIEFWLKTSKTAFHYLLGCAGSNTGASGWYIGASSSAVSFYYNTALVKSVSAAVANNAWHHIAITRASGAVNIFIDGVGATTTAYNTAMVASYRLRLGFFGDYLTLSELNGNLDDLRITKGVARYTENFIPPTQPFPDTALTVTVSGTVRDDTGALCARVVRLYRRADGQLIEQVNSDSVTGAFTFNLAEEGPFTVVCLDDDAGESYNALIFDKVVPTVS